MKAGNGRGERQAASRCFLETVVFGAEWTWKPHRRERARVHAEKNICAFKSHLRLLNAN